MKYGVMIFAAAAALFVLGGCEKKEGESLRQETIPSAKTQSTPEPAETAQKKQSETAIEKPAQKAAKVAEEVKEKTEQIAESVKEEAKTVAVAASAAVSRQTEMIDAPALYRSKCSSCHGAKGEKRALGKSALLAGQSKEQLMRKLLGYKEGSFGGGMKKIMEAQVSSLDKTQMEALAEYIATLK